MGRKKSRLIDVINLGNEIGKEAIDTAEKLDGEGNEIKSIITDIDISMDEDDVDAVQTAEANYGSDFKQAFKEEVDTKENKMENIETDAINESEDELDKVNDAADKFREMQSISDIGRDNAGSAIDKMRTSANEYEEYIEEANNIIEETKSEVDSLRNDVESIFNS